jgi:hypothetical protein
MNAKHIATHPSISNSVAVIATLHRIRGKRHNANVPSLPSAPNRAPLVHGDSHLRIPMLFSSIIAHPRSMSLCISSVHSVKKFEVKSPRFACCTRQVRVAGWRAPGSAWLRDQMA